MVLKLPSVLAQMEVLNVRTKLSKLVAQLWDLQGGQAQKSGRPAAEPCQACSTSIIAISKVRDI